MKGYLPDAECCGSVAEALDKAVKVRKLGERILVTGSFYMAEEALQWLNRTSQ
jgi:dihydrofolate synthase/folylpolyglutamate synthase